MTKALQLTPLAKVRICWGRVSAPVASSGSVSCHVEGDAQAKLSTSNVTVEAFVPRGAFAQYGLLGLVFDERPGTVLDIDVPYSTESGMPWTDSLAQRVDEVRMGLPFEYAESILLAATSFASHRLPPGRLAVVDAAHGLVGSSAELFRRLTLATLSLMQSGSREDEEVKALLKGILVD